MTMPTVLITGATGFIGGAATASLLLDHPPCRVLLLVRADTPDAAAARIRTSLARYADLSSLEAGLGRCEIIRGDLADPAALADPRLDAATHVLHLAANTSFISVRGVRRTNIDGTLALARRIRRAPGMVRFLHVGTAYVCGAEPPPVVYEDDYPRPGVRHLVEYTASKAECEMLLEQAVPDLPLVVARPSAVVGHTRLGCGPSASIFWYYRTLYLLRRLPAPASTRRDIVPVDYAADSLLRLLLKPGLRHRRYHVSAGEAAAVSWQEMMAEFARCEGRRSQETMRVVDYEALRRERDRLRERLGPGNEEHLLKALGLYFGFSTCGVEVFDNRRLLAEGLPPPPRFTSYLRACATLPPDRSVCEQMRDDE
jgi:nucleoside-diphosphate-sugar epimerase